MNFPQPCAKGTYGAATKLTQASGCRSCDAGFYCSETGADAPTAMCDSGYYCTGGATTPRPTTTAEGGSVCPAGAYCETGSANPKYCQGGYYNPDTGKKTIYDCTLCPPGQYCEGASSSTTSGNCADGYYCGSGSPVSTQNPAQPGTISNTDTEWKAESSCLQGYYNNKWAQSSC